MRSFAIIHRSGDTNDDFTDIAERLTAFYAAVYSPPGPVPRLTSLVYEHNARNSRSGARRRAMRVNTLLVNLSPRLTHAGIVAVALVLGGAAGTALSLGIRGVLPTIWQTSSSDRTTTLESALIPDVAAPLATQASGGFEVSILSDSEGSGERVIGYAVSLPSKGFTDMLGIPRFVNPDGSFVLPSEYGAVSAGEGSS